MNKFLDLEHGDYKQALEDIVMECSANADSGDIRTATQARQMGFVASLCLIILNTIPSEHFEEMKNASLAQSDDKSTEVFGEGGSQGNLNLNTGDQ